jgi:hypothetical protein
MWLKCTVPALQAQNLEFKTPVPLKMRVYSESTKSFILLENIYILIVFIFLANILS